MPRSYNLAIVLFSPTRNTTKIEIHMFGFVLFFKTVTLQGMEITCLAPSGIKGRTAARTPEQFLACVSELNHS